LILIDDHLLATQLTGDLAPAIGPVEMATTCSWWWRLASAVTGDRRGALAPYFTEEDAEERSEVVRSIPDRVTVLDLRWLIPRMAEVAARYRLNFVASEALVAAEVLSADIVVGQDTPRLREAARVRGITYLVEA
jgi:hypothetical protein